MRPAGTEEEERRKGDYSAEFCINVAAVKQVFYMQPLMLILCDTCKSARCLQWGNFRLSSHI